jgi:transcriptional regulator with XRE-family HTH domain
MRRQGETQASVAEFVDVSQPTVSNWLRGTTPHASQLEKLAQLFEITVDELVNQELPHRQHLDALTELERELRQLRTGWDAVAVRLKKSATDLAAKRGYSGAAQNDWAASSMEFCSSELAKIIEVFFNGRHKKADRNEGSDSAPQSAEGSPPNNA